MQNPQVLDLEPSPKQAPTLPFQSDASCWSPLADRIGHPPACSICGAEARGGSFIEMDSGYPMGQVTGTVAFSCGAHGEQVFSVSASNIDQWQLFGSVRPGVFRVKKKTEPERLVEARG